MRWFKWDGEFIHKNFSYKIQQLCFGVERSFYSFSAHTICRVLLPFLSPGPNERVFFFYVEQLYNLSAKATMEVSSIHIIMVLNNNSNTFVVKCSLLECCLRKEIIGNRGLKEGEMNIPTLPHRFYLSVRSESLPNPN